MISEDKNESFGSWGLYNQAFHMRNRYDSSHDYDNPRDPEQYERRMGPTRDMADPSDKITPKCFKKKENYFKTDPINGVPITSNLGYGENSPRKYVYRDWNPLLIVLELAQDLAKYDESDIEFDSDIELKGKGWGINRESLTPFGTTLDTGDEDAGAVPGERRDFCQIHKSTEFDNVFEGQIYDRRSTWRWGTKKSETQSDISQYLNCEVDTLSDISGGSWTSGEGWNEDERSAMALDSCSGSTNENLRSLEFTILNEPDKTLKLRDCQEAGCVANGSLGFQMNGCSYSKVLSYPGLHQFQDSSMDNTTRLLPDFSNLPIRDENDNLLYVRRLRTVYNVGAYDYIPDESAGGDGSRTTELKAIPLYLNDEMLEELMIKYHKLLCCYGKLDWKLFSTLFCGFSPIFDRVLKSDGTSGKKTLDEQKCSNDDPDCDGSSYDRGDTEELVTGGFYFDVSELAVGSKIPPSQGIPDNDTLPEFDGQGDCEEYSPGCERVGQSFVTEDGMISGIDEHTIKGGIESGFFGQKDEDTPGRTRFPGLKLFSEKQSKYIKMAFDYLEGNYDKDEGHLMGTKIEPVWGTGLGATPFEENLSKYYNDITENFSFVQSLQRKLKPGENQERGGANIYPGGDFISEHTWPRLKNIDTSVIDGQNITFIDYIKTQHWFLNWDNIAKKQFCHEDYFKCDAIVYEDSSWNINDSKRSGDLEKNNAYPAFSEISEKCLSFINSDICPIPHRSSDTGSNNYCERVSISEQNEMGGGPEGSSRLAPPGIKVPSSWEDIDISKSDGSTKKLKELINTGNSLDDVILSNKEGYGKYCINPIDPQYYRSNLCLDFCGNVGGEGGDGSVIDENNDQCINMVDNYCEDVFMGLKRGKTEYQLQYDHASECSSNDDCTNPEHPYCYKDIGKCGPSGISSNDWIWRNSESMILDSEEPTDTSCQTDNDCEDPNPFCYFDVKKCGPSEKYNLRQGKRSDDELDFFEVLGLNTYLGDSLTGRNDTVRIDNGNNHNAVFKDGSYYNEKLNNLFKWLYPPIEYRDGSQTSWMLAQEQRDSSGEVTGVEYQTYGCSPEAIGKGYCGLEYVPYLSPMKDQVIESTDGINLNNREPGKSNIIRDICMGHFPGYDVTDKTEDKHWLYKKSEEDTDVNFEDALKTDLTMDKYLSQDGLGVNEGELNPNYNPKIGEDENFYRWIVNKGPSLERLVYSEDGTESIETVSESLSTENEKNSESVIPDMYNRMQHYWKYLSSDSDIDFSVNIGDSDLLNALTYDKDYSRYLIHRYNRSKLNAFNSSPDLFEPDYGPHHLWNFYGINYGDFSYGDMSLIDVYKTNYSDVESLDDTPNVGEQENLFLIQRQGDPTIPIGSLNWNSNNRKVKGASLACYDNNLDNLDESALAALYQCAQIQAIESTGNISLRDQAVIDMDMDCSMYVDNIRPCDITACTQFQVISALDGIDINDQAEIIQNMECNIIDENSLIVPTVCPTDFDCSNSPNELSRNPTKQTCSSSTCTVDDCCTVSIDESEIDTGGVLPPAILNSISENKDFIVTVLIIIIVILPLLLLVLPFMGEKKKIVDSVKEFSI